VVPALCDEHGVYLRGQLDWLTINVCETSTERAYELLMAAVRENEDAKNV
jgi:hypothetical protein